MSDPFVALQNRYRRLRTYLKKEEAENYDRLIKTIDDLRTQNRILIETVKNIHSVSLSDYQNDLQYWTNKINNECHESLVKIGELSE